MRTAKGTALAVRRTRLRLHGLRLWPATTCTSDIDDWPSDTEGTGRREGALPWHHHAYRLPLRSPRAGRRHFFIYIITFFFDLFIYIYLYKILE